MAISLPTPEVTWNFQLQTRVSYTSLNQVAAECVYTVVTRLIAEGWTVKGSCDGTTGAMDAVNRWTDYTKAQTRFNGVAGAQSWIVLTDAHGGNVVFSYNGATDDRYNFWWSPLGDVVINGTNSTYEPTATTQIRMNAYYTSTFMGLVGTGTSGDRLVSVWTTNDAKNFRVAIARAGNWQCCFGVEEYAPAVLGAGITLQPSFAWIYPGDSLQNTSGRGLLGVATTPSANTFDQWRVMGYRTDGGGTELIYARTTKIIGAAAGTPIVTTDTGRGETPELQGGASYDMRSLGLYSQTSGHKGNVGRIRDWYWGTNNAPGITYGTLEWIIVHGGSNTTDLTEYGFAWPWDGATLVVMS